MADFVEFKTQCGNRGATGMKVSSSSMGWFSKILSIYIFQSSY